MKFTIILINGMLPDRENGRRIPELDKQIAVHEAFPDLHSIFANQHPIDSPERLVFEILTRHSPDIPKNADPTLVKAEELFLAEMREAGLQAPTQIVFTPRGPEEKTISIMRITKAIWKVDLRQIAYIRRQLLHDLNKTIQRLNTKITERITPSSKFAALNIRGIESTPHNTPFSVVLPKDRQRSVSGFVQPSPFSTDEILELVDYFKNYKLYTPPNLTRQELLEAA